jgi:hypothetical protein
VTAAEVLDRAEQTGVTLERREGGRLGYRGPAIAVVPLLSELAAHQAELLALLREREPEACATDAVLFAQALLRQGRFPSESAPCVYHCGHTGERCKRCGASWVEHHPAG